MTTITAVCFALAFVASAEDASSAAPVSEAPKVEAPSAPTAEAKAAEPTVKPEESPKPAPAEIKEEPKPAATEEPKPATKEEPKPIAKEAPKTEPTPAIKIAETKPKVKFKRPETAAEWQFYKDASSQPELSEGIPQALQVFVRQHIDEPAAVEAKFLEAQLREKYGDYKSALVDYLRVLNENPDSSLSLQAKSSFLALADKKLAKKYKSAAADAVKIAVKDGKDARLAAMLDKIATGLADAVFEPAVVEFDRFLIRYPNYDGMDAVLMDLAGLYEKNDKHSAALLEFKKIIAVYPDSDLRPKAYAAVGQIYAGGLRDYQKAVAAYQDLVGQYPDDPFALDALEKSSKLFSEKLKQYELAVEVDEKIVAKYPKTPSALKALRDEADLLRNRLSRPADAVAALKKIPDNAGPADAVSALEDAAQIARKDLKDYKAEIGLRKRVAADYATSKDAADQLLQAGDAASDDLKDGALAISIYKDVQSKYADGKQAKKAADRVAKLEKK